jgi:hypothetical protein
MRDDGLKGTICNFNPVRVIQNAETHEASCAARTVHAGSHEGVV